MPEQIQEPLNNTGVSLKNNCQNEATALVAVHIEIGSNGARGPQERCKTRTEKRQNKTQFTFIRNLQLEKYLQYDVVWINSIVMN